MNRIYAGLRRFMDYSHSIAIKQFCLPNIVRAVCGAFDYPRYPYYPAYQPPHYRSVITVDNGRKLPWIITVLLYLGTELISRCRADIVFWPSSVIYT